MVLRYFLGCYITISLCSCIKPPISSDIVQSMEKKHLETILVLDAQKTKEVPESLERELKEKAKEHNIILDVQELPRNFADISQTERRIQSMSSPCLLLETKATFFSLLDGRFRWEVEASYTLRDGDSIYTKTIQIPVFLQYHHQRESEAILEAQIPLLRTLDTLLNEYLVGK